MTDRRLLLIGAGAASLALTSQAAGAVGKPALRRAEVASAKAFVARKGPRCRVMVVNDLSGNVDGLFATVHVLLSSSAEVRGIIGTAVHEASETAQVLHQAGGFAMILLHAEMRDEEDHDGERSYNWSRR